MKQSASRSAVQQRPHDVLSLKDLGSGKYALLAPRLATERAEDLEEVREMIEHQELEVARDELLYLVGDCRGFVEAHNLLAELALEENDVKLARAHYGFGFENGLETLPEKFSGKLPAGVEYNPAFFEAGRGVARCLIALGQLAEGRDVLEMLLRFDPEEPEVQSLRDQLDEKQQLPAVPVN